MVRWITGRISNQREEIKCAARWAAFLKSQGTDDYVLTILPQALTFLQWYLWTQKLCALLKQPLWYQSLSLCSLISFEIVVGSLQRYLAMSLKEQPAFRDFSMYLRSSRVRCFLITGNIFAHASSPSTAVRRPTWAYHLWYERLNSTCAEENSTV